MSKKYICQFSNAMRRLICLMMLAGTLGNNAAAQDTLTDQQLNNYALQITTTIQDLGGQISHIADGSISEPIRKGYIETTLQLFANPNQNTVQVTSFTNEHRIKTESVRKYLTNLMKLNYRHVQVTWYTVSFSFLKDDNGKYIQGPDGSYYGTGTITQKFEGDFGPERKPNIDVIKKQMQVCLKLVKSSGRPFWDVKLGDIKVVAIIE